MTDKQKSSQNLTEASFCSQKPVVPLIQTDPHFRPPSISLEAQEGSIVVVESAVSVHKPINSGIYDYVNPVKALVRTLEASL